VSWHRREEWRHSPSRRRQVRLASRSAGTSLGFDGRSDIGRQVLRRSPVPRRRGRERARCRGAGPCTGASDNVLEIVIGNGPNAGTYKPPASTIMCIHFKQQKQVDLKKIGEAAINIFKSR
jgi:hypothetical protein